MTVRVLRHPYDVGTRVCHAKENTAAARRTGTAEVIEVSAQTDGSYEYLVRTDAGARDSWPSYFTVPVSPPARGRHSGTATAEVSTAEVSTAEVSAAEA